MGPGVPTLDPHTYEEGALLTEPSPKVPSKAIFRLLYNHSHKDAGKEGGGMTAGGMIVN